MGRKIYCDLCGKEFHTWTRRETHYGYEPYEEEVTYPNSDECYLIKNYICNDCFDNFNEAVRLKMIKTGISYINNAAERYIAVKNEYENKIKALEEENEKVRELINKLSTANMEDIAKDKRYGFTGVFPYSSGSYYLDSIDMVKKMKE